jgi:hypothetical protein
MKLKFLFLNPFPSNNASPVDLSLVTRGSNINANFSVWNPNLLTKGGYQTLAFSSSYILPSGSTFFTQTAGNANNTITFTEASKSTGTPSSLFRNNSTDEVLTLEVKEPNGNYADQLSFYLNDNSKEYTANNDALWDATKMTNPDVNFYSFSKDGNKLAIDRRPAAEESIALGFVAATGNYNIVVKQLPNTNEYYLKDNYLGTNILLTNNTTINIAVNSDAASQGNSRFQLVAKAAPVIAIENAMGIKLSPNPVKDVLTVTYSNPAQAEAVISITNTQGQLLKTFNLGSNMQGVQTVDMQPFASGVYTVELMLGKNRCSKQVVKN